MADPSTLPPLPKNHLDHPEQWATGAEPATEKQKGFIKVLEGQHPEAIPEKGLDVEDMGKSEASEVIEKLKNGKKVGTADESTESKADIVAGTKNQDTTSASAEKTPAEGDTSKDSTTATPSKSTTADSLKRKTPASTKTKAETPKNGDASQNDADDEASSSKRVTRSRAKSISESQSTGTVADDEKENVKDVKEDDGHVEKKSKRDDNTDAVEDASAATTAKDNSPGAEELVTPKNDSSAAVKNGNGVSSTTAKTAEAELETVPGDGEHLDHPENWTTGDESATEKQKGFLAVLEKKKGMEVENMEGMGKSEASEKIDELK